MPAVLSTEGIYSHTARCCIHPSSSNNNNNRSEALNDLYQHISEQQTAHPDAFLILAGDFNHADLKSVFPKIHQLIDFPTRGNNTLDFVYTTQRGAYKDLPLPHLGASDHITVMLMPAYRPLVKVIKPVQKQIQVWPEGSSEALQDCCNASWRKRTPTIIESCIPKRKLRRFPSLRVRNWPSLLTPLCLGDCRFISWDP